MTTEDALMSLIGSQHYLSPYESPLEDSFALTLDEYLADDLDEIRARHLQRFGA